MIASRVSRIRLPVDRSITVSAPQRCDSASFSTSSSSELVVGLDPMLALILTRALSPIAIGSSAAWCRLAGITIRPRATSSRTVSGPSCSRSATRAISGVTMPSRAARICVRAPLPVVKT